MTNATTNPPPSTALPLFRSRRETGLKLFIELTPPDVASTDLGGAFDRRTDPWVSAAAADVAGQRLIDVAVGGFGDLRQQGCGRHDLPRLAVTALHHVQLSPGLLHRVRTVGGQAFDGEDFLPVGHGRDRSDTGEIGRAHV